MHAPRFLNDSARAVIADTVKSLYVMAFLSSELIVGRARVVEFPFDGPEIKALQQPAGLLIHFCWPVRHLSATA